MSEKFQIIKKTNEFQTFFRTISSRIKEKQNQNICEMCETKVVFFTFVIDFFSVTVRQSLDLFLKLLLFSLGLFLQVGFIRAHRQSQSVCVLLQRPS